MMYRNSVFTFLFIMGFVFSSKAQIYEISGKIMQENQQPIGFAEIVIHELEKGATANENGYFKIGNLPAGSYHLHIAALGFESYKQTITLHNDTNITIILKPTNIRLKEIIIEDSPIKSNDNQLTYTIEGMNKEQLMTMPQINWINALSNLPGVQASSSPNFIAKPVIRGFSNNRIAVVDMGIQQQGQQWGAEHGLEIDDNNIQNIAIIKGPMSLIYGSNAIGGVIKISDNYVPDENLLKTDFTEGYATNNSGKFLASRLMFNKKGWYFKGGCSWKRYNDLAIPVDTLSIINADTSIALFKRRLYNTSGHIFDYKLSAGKTFKSGILRINFNQYRQKAGFFPATHGSIDTDLLDSIPNNIGFPFQNIVHSKLVVSNVLKRKKNWLEINAGYQHNHRQELEEPHDPGEDSLALDLQLATYSTNIHYHIPHKKHREWIIGTNGFIQQNLAGGNEFLIPSYQRYSAGFYSIYKVEQEKYSVIGGLRFDYAFLSTSDDGTQSTPINKTFDGYAGSIGISYHPVEEFNVKTNLSSGFRYPNIAELTANGAHRGAYRIEIGNPNLKSEQNFQLDVNVNYHQQDFLIKITPFMAYFPNYIYLERTNYNTIIYQYKQAASLHYGGEFQGIYYFNKRINIDLMASYVEKKLVQSSNYLPFTPPFQSTFTLNYRYDTKKMKWNIYFQSQYAAEQRKIAPFELITPSYMVFNSGVSVWLPVHRQKILIALAITNMANNSYFNHISMFRKIGVYEPGRNIIFRCKIPLSFKI